MSESSASKLGVGRVVVGSTAAITTGLVWNQALAVVLDESLGGGPAQAVPLTVATIAALAVAALGWRRSASTKLAWVAGLVAAIGVLAVVPGCWAAAGVLLLSSPVLSWLGRKLAARLPESLDDLPRRRRVLSALWAVLAVATLLQMARLSSFMANPELDWYLTTQNPFWAKHECLPAYFFGAELAASGHENVYDAAHYPGLNPKATPHSSLQGMTVEDPFQYAPQFLLWPYLGSLLTHDYATLKLSWFALQTTFFVVIALLLARFVGGRRGRVAALLTPAALVSFPALHTLQYGQFHLAAVGLALAAMLAFSARRTKLGGALMAVSVLSKLFPGVLLLVLAAQKRWKELGWTALFAAAMTLATLAVLGTAPFEAFFSYHLPRLQNGAAFAFGEAWPELRELVIADNQGFYGLVLKLGELGVPGADVAAAIWFNRIAALAVLALAFWTGRRLVREGSERRAVAWLGLVALASMLSTGAFGDYVPATATWLVTLVAYRLSDDSRLAKWLIAAWALQFFLVGTTPIGDWFNPTLMMVLSSASTLAMAGLCAYAVLPKREPEVEPAPDSAALAASNA